MLAKSIPIKKDHPLHSTTTFSKPCKPHIIHIITKKKQENNAREKNAITSISDPVNNRPNPKKL